MVAKTRGMIFPVTADRNVVDALGDMTGVHTRAALYQRLLHLYGTCTCPTGVYQQLRGGGTAKRHAEHLQENCRICTALDLLDQFRSGCHAGNDLRQCPNASRRMREMYEVEENTGKLSALS